MPKKLQPKIRILIGAVVAIGPGKADLLEAIGRTGSISAAGREMGMSYRRAWLLVEAINASFKESLVTTATGGKRGGGAVLTPFGQDVLHRYRAMEIAAGRAVTADLARFARLLRRR
jgi:molybdate transport system regulatory protein